MQKSTQTQKISFKMYLSTTGHVAGKLNKNNKQKIVKIRFKENLMIRNHLKNNNC